MIDQELIEELKKEVSTIHSSRAAAEINRIANRYYKKLPLEPHAFLEFLEQLFVQDRNMSLFSMGTLWFRSRKDLLDMKYFPVVEKWLWTFLIDWGHCDQFCYRILNPFVYAFPDLYEKVLLWARSEELYVRRASAVCLIQSSRGFVVSFPIQKVLEITEILRRDDHHHIQKAIGWLLKYAYLSYPDDVVRYLKDHVSVLSRTAFRYALEKMPVELRKEMMAL